MSARTRGRIRLGRFRELHPDDEVLLAAGFRHLPPRHRGRPRGAAGWLGRSSLIIALVRTVAARTRVGPRSPHPRHANPPAPSGPAKAAGLAAKAPPGTRHWAHRASPRLMPPRPLAPTRAYMSQCRTEAWRRGMPSPSALSELIWSGLVRQARRPAPGAGCADVGADRLCAHRRNVALANRIAVDRRARDRWLSGDRPRPPSGAGHPNRKSPPAS